MKKNEYSFEQKVSQFKLLTDFFPKRCISWDLWYLSVSAAWDFCRPRLCPEYGPAGREPRFPDWLPHWLPDWLSQRIYVPPIPVSKSIILSIYLPEWVVHKFVRTGSDFIYTKNSGRPGSGFYLHKEFGGSGSDLSTQRKISALRAPWVSKEKSWQINDIFKNFPALRAPIC